MNPWHLALLKKIKIEKKEYFIILYNNQGDHYCPDGFIG